MSVNRISSESNLIDMEHHFRVSAGPGAGKTHWLIEHIRNTLRRSKRLSSSKKIACITYTNIATETILNRLGSNISNVEVSTIHSFLYKHIVKPYINFIAEDYDIDPSRVDGHDDIILTNYSFLNEWKTKTTQQRIRDDQKIADALTRIKWKFDNSELVCKPDYPIRIDGYAIKTNSYLEYKKMAWKKGVIHHDDVLYFSYQIIKKFPFTLKVIREKFPYFFVDEFQDSNPIQVELVKLIGQEETTVGIIGDKAQSIYGFQGAAPQQFSNFQLDDLSDYLIDDNRRSTKEIINVLNKIRTTDLSQNCFRDVSDIKPVIIVGKMDECLIKAKELSNGDEVVSLSRDNITSNAMKREINGVLLNPKLLDELTSVDKPSSSNKYRSKVVKACIKAIEYAKEKRFKDAIKEMSKEFKFKSDKLKERGIALRNIRILLSKYDEIKDKSLYDFYLIVQQYIKPSISNMRAGNIKIFYESNTYQNLALCVKIPEDVSNHKTIHKAKGDEFKNVLLVLKDESDLQFILSSNVDTNEEHRINYVAVSRAKDKLFISIPSLSSDNETKLDTLFDIERI